MFENNKQLTIQPILISNFGIGLTSVNRSYPKLGMKKLKSRKKVAGDTYVLIK